MWSVSSFQCLNNIRFLFYCQELFLIAQQNSESCAMDLPAYEITHGSYSLALTINFLPMTDLHYPNSEFFILN
jgi:hypothetical protein